MTRDSFVEWQKRQRAVHTDFEDLAWHQSVEIAELRSTVDRLRAEVERLTERLNEYDPEDFPHHLSLKGAWAAMRQDREDLANAKSEIERLTAERDKAMTQRDALFHECEAMRQKTPPCIDCDRLKAERDRTEAALREFCEWNDGSQPNDYKLRELGLWRDEPKEDQTDGEA